LYIFADGIYYVIQAAAAEARFTPGLSWCHTGPHLITREGRDNAINSRNNVLSKLAGVYKI